MTLPIRRIVFYRHGVAYVEREGAAEGSVALEVREGDMSDVLKSLTVVGPVRAVSFETPEQPEVLAQRRGLGGLFDAPLRALLKRLRGSKVQLELPSGTIAGVLVGLEEHTDGEGRQRERVVLHAGTSLSVIDVADVRSIQGGDHELDAELGALLEHVRGQDRGEARTLRLELEGAGSVRCGYVVPAAPWRVAYRVELEGDAAGKLTAYALLHNPTDEAIEGARAVLTTGEPQSFSLDLHHPTAVRRAVVQETQRGGRAPVMYAREMSKAMPAPAPQAARMASFGGGGPMCGEDAMFATAAEEAEVGERGELFEYTLAEPLALPRGRSALVRLVSRPLRLAKERVYRADRGQHPDLVVSFDNDTGVVLEEGAAVLYDQARDYAGEAMLPLTGKQGRVRLAYGSDRALRCRVDEHHEEIMVGLSLVQDDFVEQRRHERHVTLTVSSERDDDVEVLFELPKRHGFAPMPESIEPREETLDARRYACAVPARSTRTLQMRESAVIAVRVDADVIAPRILEWARSAPLDGSHGIWQAKLLELVHARAALLTQLHEEQATQARIAEKRKQLAAELGAIGHQTPEELRVRTKLASALEAHYERSRRLDEALERLHADLDAATRAMAEHVKS